jgi:hypothetical protein
MGARIGRLDGRDVSHWKAAREKAEESAGIVRECTCVRNVPNSANLQGNPRTSARGAQPESGHSSRTGQKMIRRDGTEFSRAAENATEPNRNQPQNASCRSRDTVRDERVLLNLAPTSHPEGGASTSLLSLHALRADRRTLPAEPWGQSDAAHPAPRRPREGPSVARKPLWSCGFRVALPQDDCAAAVRRTEFLNTLSG